MNINWIENFLSLADTRGFSRSPSQRHASQSAFSRRIQSLESIARILPPPAADIARQPRQAQRLSREVPAHPTVCR